MFPLHSTCRLRINSQRILVIRVKHGIQENPYDGCSFDRRFAKFSYHKNRIYAFIWKFVVHREYAVSKKLSITMNPDPIYKLLQILQHFMDHSDAENFPLSVEWARITKPFSWNYNNKPACDETVNSLELIELTLKLRGVCGKLNANEMCFFSYQNTCLLWIFLIFC